MTALAGTALICSGSTTTQGPYAKNIRRAVDYLITKCRPNGLMGDPMRDNRYTYGHGFSMLFLSQVLGEEEDEDRREELIEVLTKAVEFSVRAQTASGGWGYVSAKDGNNNLGQAFSDNINVERVGISAADLSSSQQQKLLNLIRLYVGNMDDGHAAIKMDEVGAHIDDTWFAWVGGTDEDSVFYYRILSPVILIEFDHQRPINLRHLYPPVPNRQHVHAVMRTPNGNDYGKDLLRQHYEKHPH